MPAGTGVWVVKTVPARTAATRLVEGRAAGSAGQQLADALQAEVAGVSLVGVEHLGLGVAGDRAVGAHRPHPADADEDLLPDAVVLVAAVEPVGDAAQVGLVLLDVGVEQQQRHPADGRLPDPARSVRPPGMATSMSTGCPSASVSSCSGRPCGSSAG